MRGAIGRQPFPKKTAVSVLDCDGQVVWQAKVGSGPGPLIDKLQLWREQIDLVGGHEMSMQTFRQRAGFQAMGAQAGLTPRVYQFGEIDRSGQLSKAA